MIFLRLLYFIPVCFLISSLQAVTSETEISKECERSFLSKRIFDLDHLYYDERVALITAGIEHVWDLTSETEKSLLKIKGIGKETVDRIKSILARGGQKLGTNRDLFSDGKPNQNTLQQMPDENLEALSSLATEHIETRIEQIRERMKRLPNEELDQLIAPPTDRSLPEYFQTEKIQAPLQTDSLESIAPTVQDYERTITTRDAMSGEEIIAFIQSKGFKTKGQLYRWLLTNTPPHLDFLQKI